MSIRKATRKDALALSTLSRDVQKLHAQNHADTFKMPDSVDFAVPFFEEMLADPAVTIFLAEREEEAVGYIVCKLVERPETPFTYAIRYLHVDQISVRPPDRDQGVGASLMKQAELLARDLGLQRIQLESWDFNTKAHSFFDRLGFQKFIFRFWRQL